MQGLFDGKGTGVWKHAFAQHKMVALRWPLGSISVNITSNVLTKADLSSIVYLESTFTALLDISDSRVSTPCSGYALRLPRTTEPTTKALEHADFAPDCCAAIYYFDSPATRASITQRMQGVAGFLFGAGAVNRVAAFLAIRMSRQRMCTHLASPLASNPTIMI